MHYNTSHLRFAGGEAELGQAKLSIFVPSIIIGHLPSRLFVCAAGAGMMMIM